MIVKDNLAKEKFGNVKIASDSNVKILQEMLNQMANPKELNPTAFYHEWLKGNDSVMNKLSVSLLRDYPLELKCGYRPKQFYVTSLLGNDIRDYIHAIFNVAIDFRKNKLLSYNYQTYVMVTEYIIVLTPYDAKNIYMRMIHNEDRPWNAEEAAVQALFNEYFGGGMNTVVFQELREARGLAYNAYAVYMQPQYQDQQEYYFTHIITQNDKMMDCVRQFHLILDTIPESEASFQIAKDALTKQLASGRTTKFGLINAWITAKNRGIDYDLNQRIYEALPNVTMKDIVDFEQKNMAGKTYRYVILGNEKELDLASLLQYGNIKRVSTEEIFGY